MGRDGFAAAASTRLLRPSSRRRRGAPGGPTRAGGVADGRRAGPGPVGQAGRQGRGRRVAVPGVVPRGPVYRRLTQCQVGRQGRRRTLLAVSDFRSAGPAVEPWRVRLAPGFACTASRYGGTISDAVRGPHPPDPVVPAMRMGRFGWRYWRCPDLQKHPCAQAPPLARADRACGVSPRTAHPSYARSSPTRQSSAEAPAGHPSSSRNGPPTWSCSTPTTSPLLCPSTGLPRSAGSTLRPARCDGTPRSALCRWSADDLEPLPPASSAWRQELCSRQPC